MPVYAVMTKGPGFLSGYPLWLQVASVGVALAYFAGLTGLMVVVGLPHLLLALRNVKHARVTPWRIEADLVSGERISIEFRDVDRVRKFGRYCAIRSRHGPTISMDLQGSGAGKVLSRLEAHARKGRPNGFASFIGRATYVVLILALIAGVVVAFGAGLLPPVPRGAQGVFALVSLVGVCSLLGGSVWLAHRLRSKEERTSAPWLETARAGGR